MHPDLLPPLDPDGMIDHPERVGPYRILGILGQGGIGVVYLAEQTEPVRRQVALKVLKPGMDTRQVVARFQSERQALAVMEHPGIAKVYDAGGTEAGRPYFVMERVDGVPITEYCDTRRLGVRERIRLFIQVCRAVQHAHQKGVIHRDLKPSNVLVSAADGEPLCKVIDFGIAKATSREGEDQPRLTEAHQLVGTPMYMSPEQLDATGLDTDTRADIYSLGVVLYELLTGALPFDEHLYRGWGFVAQLLTSDPPLPSTRVAERADVLPAVAAARATDGAALRRALRGDLDWIVMRAMDRDRERRYETAAALAAELERHLRHEPVLAGPPTQGYLIRKFVRRHRAGVGFASVLALLLLGFSATVSVQASRIAQARNDAQHRQAQAEDLIGFMVGDLSTKLKPLGRLDILDDVGRQALDYFAAVPEGELSAEELFRRTEVLRQLGDVRLDQGNSAAALDAYRRALVLGLQLVQRDSSRKQWLLGLGGSYFGIGNVHWRRGEPDSARVHFTAYLQIAERLARAEPDSARYQLEVAYTHNNLGAVLESRGEIRGALAEYRFARDLESRLLAEHPDDPQLQQALANAHNLAAVAQRKLGDLHGALASHQAELALKQALVARDSANSQWLTYLANAHDFVGLVYWLRGEPEPALRHRGAAGDIYRRLLARDSTHAGWRRAVGVNAWGRAVVAAELGQRSEALAELRRARGILAAALAADPRVAGRRLDVAGATVDLARALRRDGRPAEALAHARAALAGLDSSLVSRPTDADLLRLRGGALVEAARALAALGRHSEAADAWSRAAATVEPLATPDADLDTRVLWTTVLVGTGDVERARPLARALLAQGYRTPSFVRLLQEAGISGPDGPRGP